MSGKTSGEIPGNAMESAINYQRGILRIGESLIRLTNHLEKYNDAYNYLRGLTIRAPQYIHGEWMIVIKAMVDGESVVAFHSADSLEEAVKGACNKYVYGQLKWKHDQFASEG